MAIIGVVHILNQFFAGIGGEEKANIAVGAVEGRSPAIVRFKPAIIDR